MRDIGALRFDSRGRRADTKAFRGAYICLWRRFDRRRKFDRGAFAVFFGLFEMRFEYLNGLGKSFEDLEKLKKEYIKLVVKKIKEKYFNN